MTAGAVPGPGEVVRLDATVSAEYARDPFLLEVTTEPVPSSIDAAERRSAAEARWVLLTGWRLDENGRRDRLQRDLPARRDALVVTTVPRRRGRHQHAA